ncbi:alpha/beta hydrolase fold domain-containing protein [Piscinibacter sakaiensis]|uniref:alpha/beta hydrolase fold domain-containing protein n=1 Tax=Piscinibacter sakaiensis TaxID=1547922 RepID=UPI0037280B38
MLFVHGGGFVGGDKRERPPFHDNVGWWAVRHSRIGLTLNHRLAPAHPWPAAMDDLDLALQAVQAQAAGWGLDPQRLLVVGHSAGAPARGPQPLLQRAAAGRRGLAAGRGAGRRRRGGGRLNSIELQLHPALHGAPLVAVELGLAGAHSVS